MVFLYFVLFIFELHALTSSGVTAFTVASSYQSSSCSGAKIRTASTSLDLSKLPAKNNDHDNYEIESSNNNGIPKDDVSWSLSIIALLAISIREIWYFGVEYKQECVISISMLALMFDNNNHVPFTIPLCALGISVLAAGKLFEPCQEDLVPSNSEFLAK